MSIIAPTLPIFDFKNKLGRVGEAENYNIIIVNEKGRKESKFILICTETYLKS